MSKLLLLTLNEQEEKAIDKIIAAISGCIPLEALQAIHTPAPRMTFPGLEARLHPKGLPARQKQPGGSPFTCATGAALTAPA